MERCTRLRGLVSSEWHGKRIAGGCGAKKDRILKPYVLDTGYSQVDLAKNGKYKKFSVHRLVALAFLPNPDNLPQVNHLNESRSDNRLCNLEWCSVAYNLCYGTGLARRAEKRRKPIIQLTRTGDFVQRYDSIDSAAHVAHPKLISRCCNGHRNTTGGFQWKFAKTEQRLPDEPVKVTLGDLMEEEHE